MEYLDASAPRMADALRTACALLTVLGAALPIAGLSMREPLISNPAAEAGAMRCQ